MFARPALRWVAQPTKTHPLPRPLKPQNSTSSTFLPNSTSFGCTSGARWGSSTGSRLRDCAKGEARRCAGSCTTSRAWQLSTLAFLLTRPTFSRQSPASQLLRLKRRMMMRMGMRMRMTAFVRRRDPSYPDLGTGRRRKKKMMIVIHDYHGHREALKWQKGWSSKYVGRRGEGEGEGGSPGPLSILLTSHRLHPGPLDHD